MSRIGKNPVTIPADVDVQIKGQELTVKGKLGSLDLSLHSEVSAVVEEVANDDGKTSKIVRLSPKSNSKFAQKIWPTMRTLVDNLCIGVSQGYVKKLEIHGVGYRANLQGNDLVLALGFSHEVRYTIPEGVKVEVEKQTRLKVSGIDKQRVGQVAAEIRAYKKPEPYKGKGIRYTDEYIIRKEGKKK
ncbi:MAG: 50S ribosomal protein L6 [Zetaproteobacteria bacterium]|nr:MAG: 50S ribosomal protein L6 [Zetaproteobacteria bacterium]